MSSDLPADQMPSAVALRVRDLGKSYLRAVQVGTSVKDEFTRFITLRFLREKKPDPFHALHPISFDVAFGERLGVLGGNGAGKSTLLKLLCRITRPSSGWAAIRGRVASVLEVGTGFHPDLSGRENVYLNGALLGMSMGEINARFADIVAFSEVGDFIDEPVKHYSSGMYVRLAFSVAAHLGPDVLIIDEVLAVGDAGFRDKCIGRVTGPGSESRALVFVSHDVEAVLQVCTRCLVLEHGRLVFDGEPRAAVERYRALVGSRPGIGGI